MTRKILGRIMSARLFVFAMASLAALALSAFDTPYLTFRSASSFSLRVWSPKWDGTMEYSTDAASWTTWDGSQISAAQSGDEYFLYMRGTGNSVVAGTTWNFTGSGELVCEGDIRTLRDYSGNLPAMGEKCYYMMFYGCTLLTTPPELPDTTLSAQCYNAMFNGCTALKSIPVLPATGTLPDTCYFGMFNGCSSLEVNTTGPGVEWSIPAGTTGGSIWNVNMFASTGGDFTGNPVPGTTYYVKSALPPGLELTTSELHAYTGASISIDLADTIDGGTGTYTFTDTASALSALGLSLSGNMLSGTISTAGNYNFTLHVADTTSPDPLTLDPEYTLVVSDPDPMTAATNLTATVGKAKSFNIAETISGGVPPYSLAFSGTEPTGFSYSAGVLSGTATEANTYNFTITATDSLGTVQVLNYTLVTAESSGFTDDDPEEPSSGDSVDCRTADGVVRSRTCTLLTSSSTVWNNSWYYVAPNTTLSIAGVTVNGKVSLILGDGATLTVQGASSKAGIRVAVEGSVTNSLTIYCQRSGTGKLVAKGGSAGAGIGGDNRGSSSGTGLADCGKVTIYGGVIEATGNGDAAGIGGGDWYGKGGEVAVYGGTVTASAGSSSAAGVGRGYGTSTVNGTLTVGENIVVKAGTSANPTTVLDHGANGAITLSSQSYFTFETTGPAPLAQETSAFAAYTNESKNWNLADTISGGTPSYTFTPVTGFETPSGLTLSGATLSGSVAAAGTYTIKYTVTDSSDTPLVLEVVYTLTVTAPDPITAQTDLGTVKVGKSKSVTLSDTISGGVPPYTFEFNGAHDAAFSLSGGELTFTPSAAQTYTCAITATDALGTAQNITYSVAAVEAAGFTDDDPEEPETGDSVNCLTPDGTFSRTCHQVTSSSAAVTWTDSWYYVAPNTTVTLSAGAIVSGKVSLILGDGATLTVQGPSQNAGIKVAEGNALTIYAQSTGASAGVMTVTSGMYGAGIGGIESVNSGTVNIYGGNITATGSSRGAGIGGGRYAHNGKVVIAGGIVNATGGFGGAGIGGGDTGNGGVVNIDGGDVHAVGGWNGAGIGGGYNGTGGSVTVSGGSVSAIGYDSNTPGIGAYASNQGELTVGANVVVKAGASSTLTDADIKNPSGETSIPLTTKYQYYLFENAGPRPLAQTTSTFAAYVDDSFEATLADTVSGGTKPYTFVQKSGTLPTGLSFADGVISGTPTAAGSATVVFTVSDSGTGSDSQSTDFTYTITVTAKPKKITYYNGAVEITGLTPTNYVEGVGATLAATAPAATGYTFAGWYDNSGLTGNAVTTISDAATGDKTFWAKWTPTVYTITYMDGSTPMGGLTPATYTIEAAATLPATASKTGYGFYGWYDNAGCTGDAVTTIPANSTGNKTFYAKWGIIKTSESYVDANGNSQTIDCAAIGSDTTTLASGWYVVKGSVSINSKVTVSGDVNILLADDASLSVYSSSYGPAIEVKGSNSLSIYAQTKGNGALTVTATSGPAIGSSDSVNYCGTITINGGVVTATGSDAGIGGGWDKPGGSVFVYGGTVIANGGNSSSGIGGSFNHKTEGSLTVGENVIVKAKASNSSFDSFVLKPHGADGTIALAGEQFYKIVTPKTAEVSYRDVDGSEKSAVCKEVSEDVNALVDGWYAVMDDVNLGTLGMSVSGNVNLVLVDGATLVVTGANNMAAIHVPSNSTLTIYGQFGGSGAIEAVGGYQGAGIGGAKGSFSDASGAAGTIVVNGGNITAKGGDYGAGIGGGYYGNCEAVTVNNGTVIAMSGSEGAGIGGGYYGSGAVVTISGGTVTATGGSNGAGIGGGYWGNAGGNVVISGGTVTATGGTSGAGIGGGGYGNGSDVTVTGGSVIATGGTSAVGIGKGASSYSAGTLTVSPTMVVKAGSSANPQTVITPDSEYRITLSSQQYVTLETTEAQPLSQKSSALAAYTGEVTDLPLAGTVQGGIPPYTFAFDGDHPAGVTLSDARTLSVASTVAAGEYTFRLTVTDSDETPRVETYTYKLTLTTKPTYYSITYMDGTTPISGLEPTTYDVGVGTNLPVTVEKNGYSFDLWYRDIDLTDGPYSYIPSDATGDKTFYAKWRRFNYTIYYYDEDGTTQFSGLVPTSYTVESDTFTLPMPPEREGYDFVGWYANSSFTGSPVTQVAKGSYGTKRFYAKWSKVVQPDEVVPVSFVDENGVAMTTNCVVLTSDNVASLSSGWYALTNSLSLNATVEIAGNVKLVLCDGVTLTVSGTTYKAGVYVPVSSALTIYAQAAGTGALIATGGTSGAGIGGKMGDSNNTALGSAGTIIINGGVITATGGGNFAAGIGGGSEGSGGNVTVNRGLVTANGGANSYGIGAGAWGAANGTLRVGSTMLVKAGSTTNPQDRLDIDSETGLVTVSAMLQYFVVKTAEGEAPEWAITYMDGEVQITTLSPKKYIEGIGVAELPAVPAKAGYTAGGWYGNAGLSGDAVTSISSSATGAQTLWAKYTPIAYTITYKDGTTTMTDLAPATYTTVASAVLPTPTPPEGKVFSGWYTNSTFTGSAVTAIPAGSTGDKTFYAKWNFQKSVEDYIDEEGNPASTNCLVVTSSTTTLDDSDGGWYIVKDDVSFSSTLTISGDVNLILADGATLTTHAADGITAAIGLASGNSLTIYAQSAGTGAIVATGGSTGIGGAWNAPGGSLVVYGGSVSAEADGNSSGGIGGSYNHASEGSLKVGPYARVTVKANNNYGATVVKKEVAVDGTVTLAGERYYWIAFDKVATVTYRDTDGTDKEQVCKFVSSENLDLDNGWYAVTNDLNLGVSGLTVAGSVNLIIADGASLVVTGASDKAGINVPTNCTLTIYGQAAGTGVIDATGGSFASGIGGSSGDNGDSTRLMGAAGTIVINGCDIVAQGGSGSAGIGGGAYGNGGTVTVNGGTVTATGGSSNMGIGMGMMATSNGRLFIAATRVAMAGYYDYELTALDRDSATGEVTFPTGNRRFFTVGPKPAAEYTITYYNWYGDQYGWITINYSLDQSAAKTYVEGIGATLPDNVGSVTKSGYVFGGWYADTALTEGPVTAIPADATGDKSFYLKWVPETYSITYMDMDKVTPISGLDPSTYVLTNVSIALPSPPLKNGYTFNAWYSDYELTQYENWIPSHTYGDLTVYGKWTPTIYTITYKDGDDTISGLTPTNFTIESSDVALPATYEKEGFTFGGWYLDAGCTGDAVTTVPSGSYGNRTFWAKLTDNSQPEEPEVEPTGEIVPATYTGVDGTENNQNCTTIVYGMRTLTNGWYIASGDLTLDYPVKVVGDVNIVLADDAGLVVTNGTFGKAGILVPWGHSLTIYGQENGTGELLAMGGDLGAGIGGCKDVDCGTVTVNGGIVTAIGGIGAAGVGGGNSADGGDVRVNGGSLTAFGGGNAPGVGAGFDGASQGTFKLGADVTADVSKYYNENTYVPTDPVSVGTACEIELPGDMRWYHAERGTASASTYLSFTSAETFTIAVENPHWDGELRYSTDATNWILWDGSPLEAANVGAGQYALYFRGKGNTKITSTSSDTWWTISGYGVSCTGDIETLRGYDGDVPVMANYCYYGMFNGCTALVSAPTLSRTSLSQGCYAFMFQDCVNLTTVPALPATSGASGCYNHMFDGCTGLRLSASAPGTAWAIPEEVRWSYIYESYMFKDTSGSFQGCPTNGVTYYVKGANDLDLPQQKVSKLYSLPTVNIDLRDTLAGGSGEFTFATACELPEGLSLVNGVLQGTLAAGYGNALGFTVTDTYFAQSVGLRYTLHTVSSLPELTQTRQSLGSYGAGINFDTFLTNTISGIVGECIFAEKTGREIPRGSELVKSGENAGWFLAHGLAAGNYTFEVTVTDSALRSIDCEYTFTVTANELPVLDAASPTDAIVTLYAGVTTNFSVTVHDPEGKSLQYYWYLDNHLVSPIGAGASYAYSYTPGSSGAVANQTRTLRCRVSDGVGQVYVKSWTISQPGWRYEITTDSLPAATTSADYDAQLAGVGRYGSVVWTLAEGDHLPPGLVMDTTGRITGRARTSGSYTFMVLRDEDGTIASREFTIDVTGADGAPTTFNVSSDEELKALAGKTISGDTIVIANGTTVNRLDASEYPGVTFSVASGTVRFVVDVNYPLDAQNLAVAAGASVVFEAVAAKPYFGHYDLVQMPATMAGEWSVETPFYLSSAAAVDADNILGFDALGGKDPDYGTMTVLFPDGPDVRTHELTAFESYGGLVYSDESAVDGVSVLGSTLTLKGENTFAGAISQEEGNTTIALAEGATLDVGSYVYTLGGSLALSAGSTFKFGAPASGTVVENAALGGTIVPPASGKANLELTTALADGTSVTVFDYYTGSAESFTLVVPGDVDATHYTLVCEDGHLVVKCAQPVHEGDAGTMTTSGSDSITVAQGARPNSTMVTVSGGTAPYEWSCPAATYATTRETATFDGTSGTTELSFRQRLGDLYDRNLVDLGFDFPFAGTLSREVLVNLNGSISIRRSGTSNIGKICLLGSDCPNFATANDIYVSRAEGSATIRFGRRVAVTLSADGKIRVAYGPLAEGAEKRYMPVDVIVMLYAAYDPVTAAQIEERVARFEAENGEYNGINDVVFTPTGAIPYGLHPEFNGATAKVCGTIGTVCASAGAYPVTFRCVDANGYVIEKVVTVNVTGSSSMPSATASPSLMADGVCHITYGDSQTFTVSGLSGVSAENCSWYEDDVLKGSGTASYTFVTATRPRPLLPPNIFSPKAGDTNHTRLVSCRVTDPVYGTVTLASWQVIVNTTYYIDASVVDDAANGTEAHPYRTFPEMSYQAFAGDTFLVKPGKYKTPFTAPDGWAVTLRSTGGADVTLITVDAADKAAFIQKDAEGASRAATVEGFTLVNAGGRAAYGGTLVNCVLRDSMLLADGGMDDDDLGYGGGAYGSRLVNCLVSNCSAVWGGGVANCELRNCTVVGCFADELGGGMDGQSVAYNTALWGNCAGSDGHDSNATESTPVPGYILPRAPETHSCIFEADPMLFADGRPMTGSPCLGAGDRSYLADVPGASFDLAGDSRSTSGNVTVGAYENAVEAGACRIMVKTTGAGTVLEAPYLDVDYGASATFRFRGRPAATVLTNGVLAAENVTEFVWPDVVKPGELSVAFTAVELYVDATSGSWENDGLSWATAKMTIVDALNSAGNGDIIHVKPGVYGSIVVSRISDLTDLRIVSTEGRDVTVIDAQHIGSCFDVSLDWVHNAAWERHGIVLEGFTLQNGRATGALGGGGACGGTLKDCIIENCESIGQFTSTDTARGGGASGSVLVNCIVRNCRAGKAVSEGTWYSSQAEGGGVYGGSAEKCEIYGNSCWGETRAEGPGTFDTVLRDCYVYNNKIGTYSEREQTLPAEDAALNTAGDAVAIRVATREPTTSERNDDTERIPVGDAMAYDSKSEAETAALKQLPDITLTTASRIAADKIDTYTDMFEIKTVQNADTGKWENTPAMKASVEAELREDLTDALSTVATTESLTDLGVGVTEIILSDPKPGLYYSMEFSESLGSGSAFTGPRYLSDGHSVRLGVEHHDSPTGFWRLRVYLTPTGD